MCVASIVRVTAASVNRCICFGYVAGKRLHSGFLCAVADNQDVCINLVVDLSVVPSIL